MHKHNSTNVTIDRTRAQTFVSCLLYLLCIISTIVDKCTIRKTCICKKIFWVCFVGIHGLIIEGSSFFRYISFSNQMDIKKVLVVSKLSRYEFERYKHKNLTQIEFHDMIRERGSDLEKLLYYHELHKNFEYKVVNAFRNLGIIVETANKYVSATL